MKKSEYAAKQGRSPSEKGKPASGRTRVAKTSPFHPDHKPNPHHRLALYWQRGDAEYRTLEREHRLAELKRKS